MRIVLLGGGGHASDVLGALEALAALPAGDRFSVAGILADAEVDLRRFAGRGVRQVGSTADVGRIDATHFISCVGYPEGREKLALLAESAGKQAFTVVHPRAWVPPTARLGPGCVLLAGSILSPNTRLGSHVLVGQGAVVGHDCQVGDFTSVMPAACISGDTVIGSRCVIGANATVIEKRSVGDRSVVGAGAVVTRDIPGDVVAVGIPARYGKA